VQGRESQTFPHICVIRRHKSVCDIVIVDLTHGCGIESRTILRECMLPGRIAGVEVEVRMGDGYVPAARQHRTTHLGCRGHLRVFRRRSSTPTWIPITPMIKHHMSTSIGNVFKHNMQQLIIRIKCHLARRPIEPILMEATIRSKWQVWQGETGRVNRIEAIGLGLWGLDDEIDVAAVGLELFREELHIDFLSIAVVLCFS
jgi:hypothetical protein